MSLKALMQKFGSYGPATATVATPATDEENEPRTVATVATVAVAAGQKWQKRKVTLPSYGRATVATVAAVAVAAAEGREPLPAPDAGPSIDDIAARISGWLAALDRLPLAGGAERLRLEILTRDFAFSCWAYACVQCGWNDAQLFSLIGGLIPEMSRRTLHFHTVGENRLVLIDGRGQIEEWPRRETPDSEPWWQDGRCVKRFY
jgi:hypothetical protein